MKNLPLLILLVKTGKTLTELETGGIVLLIGKNYDAFCEDGLIPADQKVLLLELMIFSNKIR